ncbi:AAA family ATPase [Schaalia sp. ZJ1691]|uniref:AAA family ATPase n=1 Tax=Schaalia sp. ZJ1691 TaxID=2709404 RepID=UPI0013E9BE80|nr:AAA family ATPase [Schaalia sp. ZJ1691]
MAVNYVSPDIFERALAQTPEGHYLTLTAGVYRVSGGVVDLQGRGLYGVGPATVLQFAVRQSHGQGELRNLTLDVFNDNAVTLRGGNMLLLNVAIAHKSEEAYPAIYAENSTLSLDAVTVSTNQNAMALEQATASVVKSSLGPVNISKSSDVTFVDSSLSILTASGGSRVRGHGRIDFTVVPGKRMIVAENGADIYCHTVIVQGGEVVECFCRDSTLIIHELSSDATVRPSVWWENSEVRVPDAVMVENAQGQRVPKTWNITPDMDFFSPAYFPLMGKDDVFRLSPGDYYLSDGNFLIAPPNCTIEGVGSSDEVTLNFSITVSEGKKATLRCLSLYGSEDCCALTVDSGNLVLDNVSIGLDSYGENYHSILLQNSSDATIRDSTIIPDTTLRGGGILSIDETSCVTATNSALAWVLNAGRATFTDSSIVHLEAVGSGRVTADGITTFIPNSANSAEMVITDDAQAIIDHIEAEVENFTVVAQGGFTRINGGDLPGPVILRHNEEASVDIRLEYVLEGQQTSSVVAQEVETEGVGTWEDSAQPADQPVLGASPIDSDPMEVLNNLTGLASVKKQISNFIAVVKLNQLRKDQGLPAQMPTMHSLFLGNPGTGKTTVARLLGTILHRAGAIESDTFVEVQRSDLVADVIGGTAKNTRAALEKARGGVLFVDEAYSLADGGPNDFGTEAINELIAYMENHRDDIVVIFAGYTDKMQDFLRLNDGLRSRLPNSFLFEDYTSDEIVDIGLRDLATRSYSVDADTYERTVKAKYHTSSDRSNGRWVRNLNDSLIQVMSSRLIEQMQSGISPEGLDISMITADDIRAYADGHEGSRADTLDELLGQLDRMIGLDSVKTAVRDMVKETMANKALENQGITTQGRSYHMVFAGNPGTGKTTVARIVAKIFNSLGILDNPTVKEVDRSSLVGSYIGHTEENTTRAVDEAMGGVLFIDEAYNLYVPDSPRDFGRAAIETLLPRLENDRHRFVCILAGYTHSMEQFFDANEGLRSRVPRVIEFPDYTPGEVAEIVVRILRETWSVNEDLVRSSVESVYSALPVKDRSNGRFARNFSEEIVTAHKADIAETPDLPAEVLRHIRDEIVTEVACRYGGAIPGTNTVSTDTHGVEVDDERSV